MEQQLRQFQQDRQSQRQKTKTHKEKVSEALTAKEEGLEDIRKVRKEEIEEAMQELEQTLRSQHDKQYKDKGDTLEKEVKEKFEKEFEEQQKARRKAEEEADEEPPPKKPKVEKGKLKSEIIQENLDDLPKKLDKLTEAKSEMVWLLKQVIKADMKRKMAIMKQNKLAAAKSS
jgi:hypothetical protein